MPLASIAQPHLTKLLQETGETVQMSVMDELQVLYISIVEIQPIRIAMGVGSYGPIHSPPPARYCLRMPRKPIRTKLSPSR